MLSRVWDMEELIEDMEYKLLDKCSPKTKGSVASQPTLIQNVENTDAENRYVFCFRTTLGQQLVLHFVDAQLHISSIPLCLKHRLLQLSHTIKTAPFYNVS